jgi:uncharacterized protein YegL
MYSCHYKDVEMMKILLAMTSLFMLVACGQEQEQENISTEPTAKVKSLKVAQAYGLRGADQTWPLGYWDDVIISTDIQARNFYVIFDGSGSMNDESCGDGQRRIDVAKSSVATFFDTLPKNVNTGLLVFDEKGLYEASPLKLVDSISLSATISRIKAGGTTPLGLSLKTGLQKLTQQAHKQQGYGEYHLVVITDGAASDPDMMNDTIKNITKETPINIHTIGFCLRSSHALNQQGVIDYSSASSSAQLLKRLKAVLAEAESFDTTQFQGRNHES